MIMMLVKLMRTLPKAEENVIKTYLMSQNVQELVVKKSLSALIYIPLESHH